MKRKSAWILALIGLIIFTSVKGQILTESNLPIIVINTNGAQIPDEPKIDASLGIIFNGDGNVNTINEAFNYYEGAIGIETRGNSTQDFDKKTYAIELRDENNADLSVNLFGMGAEEDWILHAMVIDKSQVRIPMSFYLSQRMGHYASKWRYVELMVNGEYRGLYILTERIKRDNDRVDIAKLDADDLAGDSLTGGYILRIDWLEDVDFETDGFESEYLAQGGDPLFFQWYYPKAQNIQPQQAQYIQDWIGTFEDALFSDNYMNSEGIRYDDYIDLNSFTDFVIINELSKNADGYKLSSYLHKQQDSDGGKLVAGPIWDFDQTYGVSLVCSNENPTGWTYLQNQDACEDLESMPLWWQEMMNDALFQDHLKCRWETFRNSFLHQDSLNNWIEADTALISAAIERNFTQWDDFIGEEIWYEPDPLPETYAEEISTMQEWIEQRLDWMDAHMPGTCSTVGLGENLNATHFKVYPNPTNDLVFIQADEAISVIVMGGDGRILIHSTRKELDLSALSTGVYILKIESAGGMQTSKVLKY